jgi:hypothetical protein
MAGNLCNLAIAEQPILQLGFRANEKGRLESRPNVRPSDRSWPLYAAILHLIHSRIFMSDRRWYRYGITQETYEQMLFEQDGVCAVCRCEPTIINGIERPVLA